MTISNSVTFQTGWRNKLNFIGEKLAVMTAFALPLSTTMTDFLFLFTAAFSFLAAFMAKDLQKKFEFVWSNPAAKILLAVFAMFIIGMFYSQAPLADALHTLKKYDKLLLGVFLLPLFKNESVRLYAQRAFLCAIGVLIVLSYIKSFGHLHFYENCGPSEVFKKHIEFNFLMSFAGYLLLLEISEAKNLYARGFFAIFLSLVVYEIFFMSIGRAGYFVFASLLFLFFLQKKRWKGIFITLAILSVLISSAYVLSGTFKNRVDLMFSEVEMFHQKPLTSVGLRIVFDKNSLALFKKHPFIGTGTGSFKSQYAKIKPTPAVLIENPHNEYLLMAVQFGSFGILLLLALFGVQFYNSFYLPKKMRYISQALLLAIMIGSLANSWLLDTTQGHVYVFFIALAFASFDTRRINRCISCE